MKNRREILLFYYVFQVLLYDTNTHTSHPWILPHGILLQTMWLHQPPHISFSLSLLVVQYTYENGQRYH